MTTGLPATFDASFSRPMWEAVERFHGFTYIAPEVREEGSAAGLKGFWMNYFATRIAPVGAVGPEIVDSAFFYYAPTRIRRAIPDAWSFSTPKAVVEARYLGMDRAIRRHYARNGTLDDQAFAGAASVLRTALSACEPIGRTLFAGWASLDWPEEPHLALWHACTLLREYRSGNHLIAICAEGLDGIESIVSHVAVDGAPRAWIQDEAGWTAEDEAAAVVRLQGRGWLDEDGNATPECYAGRRRIEAMTDALDFPVWESLGEQECRNLQSSMRPLVDVLPPDDQLDWEQIYSANVAQ